MDKEKKKIHILFVDDDAPNLLHFEYLLRRFFIVSTAPSGLEGLELLNKNNDIKVVISDIRMPKMSGMEFIEKANQSFPGLKFIVLTGYSMNEEIAKAMKEGIVSEYFQKPYDVTLISSKIKSLAEE